jgi:hypothetical protein
MSAPKSKSTKELLAAAKLPERSVTVCVRGDLVAEIEELERELKAAIEERKNDPRLTSKSPAKDYADKIQAKRAEMDEHTITFRLRGMKAATWREFTSRHKGADGGLDILALMGEALPASVVSPELDAEDWERFNDNVAASEIGKLIDAVWELNMQGVAVPKSPLASAVTRTSGDDSKQPEPGA